MSFDPETGTVRLEHLKRRSGAGPKLSEFYLEATLVTLDDYPAPIPVVTGPKDDTSWKAEQPTETERHARELVQIMVQRFPEGATNAQLRKQSGMKDSTFDRALACAHKEKGWFIGGGGRGMLYNLKPDLTSKTSPSVLPSTSPPSPSPYKGVRVIGGDGDWW